MAEKKPKPLTLEEFRAKFHSNDKELMGAFRYGSYAKDYTSFMKKYKKEVEWFQTDINDYISDAAGDTRPTHTLKIKDSDYPEADVVRKKFDKAKEQRSNDDDYDILIDLEEGDLFPLTPKNMEEKLKDLDHKPLENDAVRAKVITKNDILEKLFKDLARNLKDATKEEPPGVLDWWTIYKYLTIIEKWLGKTLKSTMKWLKKFAGMTGVAIQEPDEDNPEEPPAAPAENTGDGGTV